MLRRAKKEEPREKSDHLSLDSLCSGDLPREIPKVTAKGAKNITFTPMFISYHS
jgi:hypothetical protein